MDVGCGEAAAVIPPAGPEPRGQVRSDEERSAEKRGAAAELALKSRRQRAAAGAGPHVSGGRSLGGRGGARPLGGAAGGAIAVPREGQRRGLRGAVARCPCAPRAAVRLRAARFVLGVLASFLRTR